MAGKQDADQDDLSGLSPEEIAAIGGNDVTDDEDDLLDDIIGDDSNAGDPDPDALDDDADPVDAQADNADADAEETPAAEFQPQTVTQPVENFNERMQSLEEQKADLRRQLNEGDIDLEKYEELKDKVAEEATELRLQQRDHENELKRKTTEGAQRWQWEQDQFFGRDANKIYNTNKILGSALNTAVIDLANDPANGNRDGAWFLEEADRQVRALMGGNAPADKPAGKQNRKPDLSGIPKTLSNVPAAENTETGGEEFLYLDKLSGAALEAELAKIARDPAKEARYLRS